MHVTCTLDELNECMFGTANYGGCTTCGIITHFECEPDARAYECPDCGNNTVFGLEELLVMNMLDIEK